MTAWPKRPLYPLPEERLATELQMLGGPGTGAGRSKQPQTVGTPRPGQRSPDRPGSGAIFGLAQWGDIRSPQTLPGFAVTDDLIVESGAAGAAYSQFGGVDSVELLLNGYYQAAAGANIAGATPGDEFRIEVTVPQWGTFRSDGATADALGEAKCYVLSPIFYADVDPGGDETIQAFIAQLSGSGATFQQAAIILTRFV